MGAPIAGLGTILVALLIASSGGFQQATTIPACRPPIGLTASAASVPAEGEMPSDKQPPRPTTFREGEVIGLRLMQDGLYEEALGGEAGCEFWNFGWVAERTPRHNTTVTPPITHSRCSAHGFERGPRTSTQRKSSNPL